jgi:hypothetical protein
MRRLLLTLCLLAVPATAFSQTHYCDAVQPTTATDAVGTPSTVQNCQDGKSQGGLPVTITSWTLYVNGVAQPITMTKGTTSTVSGKTLYTGTVTFTTAGVRTLQTTATGHDIGPGDLEGLKSNIFTLTSAINSAPSAPTSLTAQ